MPGPSNIQATKALQAIFGNGHAASEPAIWYVGLYKAEPSGAGGGTEPSGGGYARIAVPNDNTHWQVSGSAASNLLAVPFAPASIAWGKLPWWGLFDDLVYGAMQFWGKFAIPILSAAGAPVRLHPGDIQVGVGRPA